MLRAEFPVSLSCSEGSTWREPRTDTRTWSLERLAGQLPGVRGAFCQAVQLDTQMQFLKSWSSSDEVTPSRGMLA